MADILNEQIKELRKIAASVETEQDKNLLSSLNKAIAARLASNRK